MAVPSSRDKALLRYCAIAFLDFVACPPLWAVPLDCGPGKIDEYATIRQVIDGDTVTLSDGRNLRLIGINTPEIGYDGQASEPYAESAREALKRRLWRRRVGLIHGQQGVDKYQRWLAHVFLSDDTNVQEWLLRQGLALRLAVPPNLGLLDCYTVAEADAKRVRRGIWGLKRHQPIDVDRLRSGDRGFRIVRGTVTGAGSSASSIWINLGPTLALRIVRADLPYFRSFDVMRMAGRAVTARGWLYQRQGRLRMRIRHPADLCMAAGAH